MKFCASCQPSEHLQAWVEGKHHNRPRIFGDAAQRATAMNLRQAEFWRRFRIADRSVIEWPEMHCVLGDLRRFVEVAATPGSPHCQRLVSILLEDSMLVAQAASRIPTPSDAKHESARNLSSRQRRKRAKAARRFNQPYGGRYRRLKRALLQVARSSFDGMDDARIIELWLRLLNPAQPQAAAEQYPIAA